MREVVLDCKNAAKEDLDFLLGLRIGVEAVLRFGDEAVLGVSVVIVRSNAM